MNLALKDIRNTLLAGLLAIGLAPAAQAATVQGHAVASALDLRPVGFGYNNQVYKMASHGGVRRCTYGVDCGGMRNIGSSDRTYRRTGTLMSMFMYFDGITAGTDAVLDVRLSDLNLQGTRNSHRYRESFLVVGHGNAVTSIYDSRVVSRRGSRGSNMNLRFALGDIDGPVVLEFLINNRAQGYGRYNRPTESLSARISYEPIGTVPLPGSLPLLLGGVAAMAGVARRRRKV